MQDLYFFIFILLVFYSSRKRCQEYCKNLEKRKGEEKRENDSAKRKGNVASYKRKGIQGGPKAVIVLAQQYFSTHFDTKRTGVKTLLPCGPFLVLIPHVVLAWKASFLFSLPCLYFSFLFFIFLVFPFFFVYFHSKYEKSTVLECSFYFLSLSFSSEFSFFFSFLFHSFLLYFYVGQVRYSSENSNA